MYIVSPLTLLSAPQLMVTVSPSQPLAVCGARWRVRVTRGLRPLPRVARVASTSCVPTSGPMSRSHGVTLLLPRLGRY